MSGLDLPDPQARSLRDVESCSTGFRHERKSPPSQMVVPGQVRGERFAGVSESVLVLLDMRSARLASSHCSRIGSDHDHHQHTTVYWAGREDEPGLGSIRAARRRSVPRV